MLLDHTFMWNRPEGQHFKGEFREMEKARAILWHLRGISGNYGVYVAGTGSSRQLDLASSFAAVYQFQPVNATKSCMGNIAT